MSTREPSEAAYLAAILATERGERPNAYLAARDAESLLRLGKRAARIAVRRCNGVKRWSPTFRQMIDDWTDADQARADKACDKIAKEAFNILESYGATEIKVGGDPRGFCLTFRLASRRSNSFDRDRWGV